MEEFVEERMNGKNKFIHGKKYELMLPKQGETERLNKWIDEWMNG